MSTPRPEPASPRRLLRLVLTPARLIVLSFAAVIALGTALLCLPAATVTGTALPGIDALFGATTSVCVTGLVVRDTGSELSSFGQGVTLFLIQLGGLGYMTLATMLLTALGRRVGVHQRLAVRDSVGGFSLHDLHAVLKRALVFTLLVEGVGAGCYAALFAKELPLSQALWQGLFHSVSAFCNAGLDLFGRRHGAFCSLEPFAGQSLVVMLTAAQIVLGGLGFVVVSELLSHRPKAGPRLSLHTNIALRCTVVLIALGALVFFLLERRPVGTLHELPLGGQLLHALFMSITCRTAGFSTVPLSRLQDATLVFMCFLMFVGGSPGGTAGGIKTTTLVVVLSALWTTVRGEATATVLERSLSHALVYKALTVFALGVGIVFACTTALLVTEEAHLVSPTTLHSAAIHVFFESTSAFGTVGLSTGITPTLTTAGKLIIILTMFLGRIGPVSLAAALAARERPTHSRYPEGVVPIG